MEQYRDLQRKSIPKENFAKILGSKWENRGRNYKKKETGGRKQKKLKTEHWDNSNEEQVPNKWHEIRSVQLLQ